MITGNSRPDKLVEAMERMTGAMRQIGPIPAPAPTMTTRRLVTTVELGSAVIDLHVDGSVSAQSLGAVSLQHWFHASHGVDRTSSTFGSDDPLAAQLPSSLPSS